VTLGVGGNRIVQGAVQDIIRTVTIGSLTIPSNSGVDTTTTVSGAVVGAAVSVSPLSALVAGVAIGAAYVSATNTVRIQWTNSGGSNQNAAGSYRVRVANP
jgi:hypothetical protein